MEKLTKTQHHDGDDVAVVMLVMMMLTTMPTMPMMPMTVGMMLVAMTTMVEAATMILRRMPYDQRRV